ncbi:MAG TPA: thiamine-phosphate kinase [Longimicrobiales bacterium]
MPTPLGPGPEFDLIRRFLEHGRAYGPGIVVGPGDDCAVVEGGRIALSADLSIEDVHFRRGWLEPEEIGYRAAAASLSDLAAMAAVPIGALVSLAAPPADVPAVAERCMAGAREAVEAAGGALLGGDLTRSPGPLLLDVVVLGRVERPVLRGGARPGDEVWVTGALGGAAAAVRCWGAGDEPPAAGRAAFARPRPRIREALWLAERDVPRAMIDLSDGLAGDVAHLAAAGGVGVLLDEASVPVHPAAAAVATDPADALALALGGGEDYELCLAVSPGAAAAVAEAFHRTFGVALTRVGVVREEPGIAVRRADGTVAPPDVSGYRHFVGGSA